MKRIKLIGEILVFALLLVGFVANALTITGGYKETISHSITTVTSVPLPQKNSR